MVTTATITDIVRSSYLSCLMTEPFYRCKLANYPWQGRQDLNLRPSVLETDALPTELLPYACCSSRCTPDSVPRSCAVRHLSQHSTAGDPGLQLARYCRQVQGMVEQIVFNRAEVR